MTKLPIIKFLITFSIYCCVFSNGICSNIYGPTWLDLKSLLNTSLERMSLSISLRAAFFCAGAIAGGFIFKFIDRGVLYPFFILTKGLCVALIPLFADFRVFLTYSAIIGLVSGAADTSVNVWIIDIWKDKSAPFVQALQFFWALGFIVSPLISNPFLSIDSKIKKLKNFTEAWSTTESIIISTTVPNNFSTNDDLFKTTQPIKIYTEPNLITNKISDLEHKIFIKNSKLYIPYGIAGSLCLFGSISLLIIFIYQQIKKFSLRNKINKNQYKQGNQTEEEANLKEKKKNDDIFENHERIQYSYSKTYIIQVLLYCCFMTSVFCASEMTTFQFIATFCVKLNLGLTKFNGSIIMTGLATSFAVGRFVGILTAIKFKPVVNLWFDWFIILLGNITLVFSNSGILYLWIGSILVGFGYASFFAAIFSYLRERIIVNNLISSIVILSSLSGNAFGFPVLIGKYMDTIPLMLIYGNLFCLLIMFICLFGLLLLDYNYGIKEKIIKKLKKSEQFPISDAI